MAGEATPVTPVVVKGNSVDTTSYDGDDIIGESGLPVGSAPAIGQAATEGTTQAPAADQPAEETAAPEAKPQDPIAALRLEFDQKLRQVQSTKDAEVAQAKAEAYQLKQAQDAQSAELRKYQQWQAQQQQLDAERQRAEQEAAKKAWLAQQPPEMQAAFAAADQAMQQERDAQVSDRQQKAQQMAWVAVNNGIPPEIVNDAMRKFGTPEAVYHATENYLNWQYYQETVVKGNQQLQAAIAKVKALPPEERARLLAAARAQNPAAQRPSPFAAPGTPMPQPPQVTPGSTGNQPPSDLVVQFNAAMKRRDFDKAKQLQRQFALSSGVNRTSDD